MDWKALTRDIWDGTRSQGARVTLSFLGIATGMIALVFLLAIVGGLRERSRAMIRELGVNVFAIIQTTSDGGAGSGGRLDRRHQAILSESLSDVVTTGISWSDLPESDVKGGGTLLAADENILKVRPWLLRQGRGFDPEDIRTHARYALVGAEVAEQLGLALGSDIRIRSVPFRIIGILGTESDSLSVDAVDKGVMLGERVVIVPWSVAPYRSSESMAVDEGLSAIFVKVTDPDECRPTIRRAEALVKAPDCDPGNVHWVTPQSLVDKLLRLQRSILLAGGSIVALCILLGGSTLTALLLAGVQERIPEIGLRRALGASSTDVATLFMGEALFITLSATFVGSLTAGMLLALGKSWFPFDVHVGVMTLLWPLFFGAIVGIAASVVPARSAARIAPSEALRND